MARTYTVVLTSWETKEETYREIIIPNMTSHDLTSKDNTLVLYVRREGSPRGVYAVEEEHAFVLNYIRNWWFTVDDKA